MVGPGAQGGKRQIITFYSYKGGTGRTMALANVAWLLASNGYRVLAVDWDLESPGLHRYFHPFLVDKDLRDSPGIIDLIRQYAGVAIRPDQGASELLSDDEVANLAGIQRYATSLTYSFGNEGGIDFVPAGKQAAEYSSRVSSFNWDDFFQRLGGSVFLKALRRDLRAHYDYVLIDSRTGLSDTAGICTVFLPDVLVNLFTLNTQSIHGAEAIAKSVRKQRRANPLLILPVPTRIEDAEQAKLDRSRSYARERLEPFVRELGRMDLDRYWGSVEIPYKPYYAYEEVLAPFVDRPHNEGTLLASYERLATVITDVSCHLPAPMSEASRTRFLAEFERRPPTRVANLVISYASKDRVWAEWVTMELDRVGQRSTRHELGDPGDPRKGSDRILVLLSRDYAQSARASRLWFQSFTGDDPGFLVFIRLDATPVPPPYRDREFIDLHGVITADRAREALMSVLALPLRSQSEGEDQAAHSFPTTGSSIWRVPARNPSFVGRDLLVEELRDRLQSHPTSQPVALTGMSGVGKTQIATEYAYRFASFYDIVWWVPADQSAIVRTEVAKLAGPMRLAGESTTSEQQSDAVLRVLRQGTRYPRWLIVFDSSDDPDQLRDFLPDGLGDVIITTRNPAWATMADCIEVGVFERSESVELMSRRVAALSPIDADAVAEKLGDLPLVVEQAAAWLATTAIPVGDYLALLDTELSKILAEKPPSGSVNSAFATWTLALDQLRARRPAAARLMELLACLSPEPIPTRLISTPHMVEELVTFDRGMRDPLLHGSLIRDIGRFALARVDPATNAIRVHRLVQTVIRDAMAEEDRLESQRRVHHILAAATAVSGGPDSHDNWPLFEDVRPHLQPSGALASREDEVRQFVLDMVRYLMLRGDLAGSRELAERALASWAELFTSENDLTLRMQVYLANTLRAAGRDRDSLSLSRTTVTALTNLVGADHPYTLEAIGGLAADMWSFGKYQEALPLNRDLWRKWREELGEEHERTLMAANNVATVERLCGHFREAAKIDKETLETRRRVFGEENYWTQDCAINYARDLRDLGDYAGARRLLESVIDTTSRVLGEEHRRSLRASRSLAVTLRRLGLLIEAAERVEKTLRQSEAALGAHHPETMMCSLEFAGVQSALGQHDLAISEASDVLRRFRETYGDTNPSTLAAANNLGSFLLNKGEAGKARPIMIEAVERCGETLGDDHPHTIVCQLNLASANHAIGNYLTARQLDDRSLDTLLRQLDPEHPTAIVAKANRALSLRDSGAELDAREQLQEALRLSRHTLGDDHPITQAIRASRRIGVDIEPQPI